MISAILLAAGEAKRMGKPKMLMPFGSGTVLEWSLDNLLASRADEVIVVLGPNAEAVKQVIADRQVKIAVNPDYHLGMSTSLITGLKLVNNQTQRIIVALADQPLVCNETYNRLIEASLCSDKGITIPVYQGKRGNPVIFSAGYKQELTELEGDVGGKEVTMRHPDDVLEVDVHSECVNLDINTTQDYLKLLNYESNPR